MTLLYWFNLMGTAVFALTGVLTAVRKRFDPIGILVISTVTAIGGGTVRDLLLGIHPIAWIRDIYVLYTILGTVVISLAWIRFLKVKFRGGLVLLLADSMGLALFTIGGTQVAEHQGVHWMIAIVMGTMTGSAGGVIRDVLTTEAPTLFKQTELYATASIIGAGLYLILEYIGFAQNFAAIVGMLTVFLLRIAAAKWKITLPVFDLE